jgi:hypothetical protein
MTWLARVLSAVRPAPGDTVSPAFFLSKRSEATDGPAPIIAPKSKPDGLRPAETRHSLQMQMLLARREILCQTAAKMRDQRRCREASICEASARRVVYDILAGGET